MKLFKMARFLVVLLVLLVLAAVPQAYAEKLDFAAAADMVKDYYDNQGEWSGVFAMSNIEKMVLKRDADGYGYVAHVCYKYRAIPGNRQGRTDKGLDQRTFQIGMVRGGYRVLDMGGHMSSNVGCR